MFTDFFQQKIFWIILALFANFEAERAKNGSKKIKNLFSKCVLDFNFAPIKGLVFFNFQKKVKFVVPYCTSTVFL
jgi:hypothetical protein